MIDMSPYCNSSAYHNSSPYQAVMKRECFTKLNHTLQTDGFAFVHGLGIQGSLCNDALKAAKSFLHDADESVRRSCLTKDRARRGYSPASTENFASLIGEEGPNDVVKKYRVGPESRGGDPTNGTSTLHQANAWPAKEVWSNEIASFFRSTTEEYFEKICIAAVCILNAICDGLIDENPDLAKSISVLANSSITEATERGEPQSHTSILTLLGYQVGSRHKKGHKAYMRPLIAAHTDVGMITVLLFNNGKCCTLQRASNAASTNTEDQEWIDVNLPQRDSAEEDPVFVVNVGDCLSELSRGVLRSTLHRVVPRSCSNTSSDDDVSRTSLALFCGLEPTAQLVLSSIGESMTYEEWRRKRIQRSADILKQNRQIS